MELWGGVLVQKVKHWSRVMEWSSEEMNVLIKWNMEAEFGFSFDPVIIAMYVTLTDNMEHFHL